MMQRLSTKKGFISIFWALVVVLATTAVMLGATDIFMNFTSTPAALLSTPLQTRYCAEEALWFCKYNIDYYGQIPDKNDATINRHTGFKPSTGCVVADINAPPHNFPFTGSPFDGRYVMSINISPVQAGNTYNIVTQAYTLPPLPPSDMTITATYDATGKAFIDIR